MRQEFFTNTIQSKFIKNLIYNTPLPCYDTVNDGDLILNGFTYIYKQNVIRCLKTGFLHSESDRGGYEIVRDFTFGKMYSQFTERYKSNNIYYDSETHEWLGKYLRCYRDIYGVDMMPFYNCVSNNYLPGYTIHPTYIANRSSSLYKILKIPVDFNRKYTIALDSGSNVSISPIFLDDNNNMVTSNGISLNSFIEDRVVTYTSTSFKRPFIWELNLLDFKNSDLMYKYKDDLYLLIQVDYRNNSSIVVLEGDYTNTNSRKVISFDAINEMTEKELNEKLLYNISLLQINENKIYPFSDTLIEYLLWNVIHSNDIIDDNFTYVKNILPLIYKDKTLRDGIYTDQLRKKLFDFTMDNERYQKWDVNGFLTKGVENSLLHR